MAELGAAAIGAGAAFGAAVYTTATGFVARHESVHSLQVTEIRRHITDFEAAFGRGEVTEEDWKLYLAIRTEARQKESEYEQSIAAYKETPTFRFLIKWKNKRQVRQRKKALQEANRSLRLHYYESTSDASDASSVTAASGSPPRSRNAHSDEDDKRILSWAEDVANSDSDGLGSGPSSHAVSRNRRQRIESEQRRREELRDGYAKLKGSLALDQMVSKPYLIDRATQHILGLEERNKELRARFMQEKAELERLRSINRVVKLDDSGPSNPDVVDAPFPPSPSNSHEWDFSFCPSPETDFVMYGSPDYQALPYISGLALPGFVDMPSLV